jgi:hypothetical protein
VAATSTTADIEPPPPSVTSTQPIPTAPQPPDTTGGSDADFLLAPKAIAGLQFGASQATVLSRLRTLLGDPLRVDTLAGCPGGPATALQWFNAAVIVTDRGLAYYQVVIDLDAYQDQPVPGWHTAAGLAVGADRAALEAAYPQQITYAEPTGLFTPFTVAAGADAGIGGRLEGEVVNTVSAGSTTC